MNLPREKTPVRDGFARAWIELFDDYREGRSVLLGRQRLDHALRFKLRAAEPGVAESLHASHGLLEACLGDRDLVMVGRVEDELPRPRVERLAPRGSVEIQVEAKRVAQVRARALPGTRSLPPGAAPPSLRPRTAVPPPPPSGMEARSLQERPTPSASWPPSPSSARASEEPRPPQMLGRFLLAHGRITLTDLTDAILWQRAQRPAVGRIAQDWRILTHEQVVQVLRDKPYNELFCDYAVRVGLMTPFHRTAIIAKQRKLQRQIGQYFVEKGLLSRDEVEDYARRARLAG